MADLIEAAAVLVDPERTITTVSDQADNRVLEAAVKGGADYIVSGDKHLLAIRCDHGSPRASRPDSLEVMRTSEAECKGAPFYPYPFGP